MPRISIVVPIYNVEDFLAECLQSVAAQTVEDFEVVMVDDGSTDGSAAIADGFVRADPRFKLVSQENGGLSKARNTGTASAQGEFLAFLDSDDVLPPNAYELLLGALDETGSDFATGNVLRLTRFATVQSGFLAGTFGETRLKTHVTRFRPLLSDRTAWNKLWRRAFWDRHGFRFPEGRLYEDIPVTLPAHFLARSVDVIADPVYYWRIREGGGKSITQRRLEPDAMRDRIASLEEVSEHLSREGNRRSKRWYEETVVADDLRYFLNALDAADDDYRALFLDRVNAFLDGASPRIYDPLPAIERLKWHLIRRRLMPEFLEVLRFQKDELADTPPVRIRGKWYGDFPFRTDPQLRIPRSIYRLEGELTLKVQIEELRRDGDALRVRGHAYINGVGSAAPDAQRVSVSVLPPGRLRRIRLITSAVRLRTRTTHRPDVTANSSQGWCDVSWSGFEATLDPADLRRAGRWREGTSQLYVTVRAAGVKRRRSKFVVDAPWPVAAVDLPASPEVTVRAEVTPDDTVAIDVRRQSVTARSHRLLGDDALELAGDVRLPAGAEPRLELRRESDDATFTRPLELDGGPQRGAFTARVPLARLRAAEPAADADATDEPAEGDLWLLSARGTGRRVPIGLPADVVEESSHSGGRELALIRTRQGDAALVDRPPRLRVTEVRWADGGDLVLSGRMPAEVACGALVLARSERRERHVFPVDRDAAGRFSATLTPARIRSLAGTLPVAEGRWALYARVGADDPEGALTPVVVSRELYDRLPLATVVGHKPFTFGVTAAGDAVLVVQRDLDEDERGPYHQRRLRDAVYVPGRAAPLRDAVVYTSFHGRQYSDSPRAIHEELVRREAPVEHLWVVRDGRCQVPESATVLRDGSREYHEALARARFVVANDHFPDWFVRRPDQLCLQTWHGTPLKRLGLDVSEMRRKIRRFQRRWDQQVANWQYVLSPNRFSTPILRRAYAIEGEMLETGYPRVDVLARPDRDALGRQLRRRLGLPDDVRVVLYAPTYRDQVVDRRGRYRLDLHLDVERLRQAVGHDTVILFRKHHYVVDAVPESADGFVRDVSSYPDGTELLLAADVLVTDYSSMMVDFANTGRPMLFFTYDLDAYEDEIRGFYLDFVGRVPGPLLRTTEEVADALRDLEGVQAQYADRYEAFRQTFCELDDGHAAARVADRLLSW